MLSRLLHRRQFLAHFAFAIAIAFTSLANAQVANKCEIFFKRADEIIAARGMPLPPRGEIAAELAKFAAENALPSRWVEVGPPERRVKRLLVGVDIGNEAMMNAYLQRFNLDKSLGKTVAGTLVLEFQNEAMGGQDYVTGVLRPGNSNDSMIYRWGFPEQKRSSWWQSWMMERGPEQMNTGLVGYGHLIELNAAEQANVKYYLQHSNVNKPNDIVGPCKSTNCVAWTTNIELGKTQAGATAEERMHLFNELGIARASAHFEIGRRLIHAASERHNSIVVFYDGEKGLKTFETNIDQILAPIPKIPYASIIRGVRFQSPATAAVALIPDGAKIFVPIAAGASPEGFAALVDRAMVLKQGFDVHVLVNGVSANEFRRAADTTDGKFRTHALFLGSNLRQLHSEGKVSVIPGNLSDFTRIMRDPNNTDFHYDAILVRVSKPDAQGRYSLGPNNDMIMTILRNRPDIKVVAEVNENVPFTKGENFILENQITAKFESKTELAGPAAVPPNAVDTAIGRYIGELVDSGATLQIGIGNIFSGVPNGLAINGRRGIKISTEMFGDTMMEMMNKGIAVSAETGFAYGSAQMYRWLNHNDRVVFKETEYVNSPGRVADTPKFHAVNTALQVNLFGEVNATMGPTGRISSPGGQVEFMTGAARSAGGKAIIAVRSTAKNGELSSIVLDLYKGPITTPHESVTHVVTEYGVATLQGKNEMQRAAALISIAHPKFRPELIKEALERKMITAEMAKAIPAN